MRTSTSANLLIEMKRVKLLLHVCCGPCAALPISRVSGESRVSPGGGGGRDCDGARGGAGSRSLDVDWRDIEVTGLFFNPNIHPADEFDRRLDGAVKLFESARLPLIIQNCYMQREWELFETGGEHSDPVLKKNLRCEMCYETRLSHTAGMAREKGFDAFSTTLLISPYQNHEKIVSVCKTQSGIYGVGFFYWDGRPFFREGQKLAKDIGLYRQKYCGCIFSLNERKAATG